MQHLKAKVQNTASNEFPSEKKELRKLERERAQFFETIALYLLDEEGSPKNQFKDYLQGNNWFCTVNESFKEAMENGNESFIKGILYGICSDQDIPKS